MGYGQRFVDRTPEQDAIFEKEHEHTYAMKRNSIGRKSKTFARCLKDS